MKLCVRRGKKCRILSYAVSLYDVPNGGFGFDIEIYVYYRKLKYTILIDIWNE